MTVRSKPLLILSAFFLVVALVGVAAIIVSLAPRLTQGVLKLVRTARDAGRYADSEIHFKQALQLEPRNAVIHEEFAGLYKEWLAHASAEKSPALRREWLDRLVTAAQVRQSDERAPQGAARAMRCRSIWGPSRFTGPRKF